MNDIPCNTTVAWWSLPVHCRKAHAKAVDKEKQHSGTLDSLAGELEDVRSRSEVYEEEVASQSQDEGLQLVDSQLKEYYHLQAKADKKSANHSQELETVCVCVCGWVCVCGCVGGCVCVCGWVCVDMYVLYIVVGAE